MTLSLANSPSDVYLNHVGEIDNTTVTPTIRLKPVSALKRQVDNDPTNDVLLTEIVATISADEVSTDGTLNSERFYLTGGTETTYAGEAIVEYTTVVRGIFNTNKTNPPVAGSGGDRNYKTHATGARCVLDGGFLARRLEEDFEATVNDKVLQATCFDYTTDVTVGDGRNYFVIPDKLDGTSLNRVHARVITAGTTGTTDIQIRNVTDTADMLSTKLTIDSTETGSDTAATPAVIDNTAAAVATNDLLAIDIDATASTKAKGLIVTLEFRG